MAIRSALSILALLAAAPAIAEPAAPVAPGGNSASTNPDPDQQIRCRRLPVTGSMVRQIRACRTVAQWREMSARGNENARAIVESGNICAGGECRGN